MGEFYFFGLIVQVIIGIFRIIYSLGKISSIEAENFKKVGLFYKFSTDRFIETATRFGGNYPIWRFFYGFVFSVLILAPLLSWFGVVLDLHLFYKSISNKLNMPEELKKIRYQVASNRLTEEEMLFLIKKHDSLLESIK